MGQEIEIRPFRPGDEVQIVALFDEVFGEKRSIERWRWQFQSHPKGPASIVVGERDGVIVGTHAFMTYPLNVNGREVSAAQECDAMIKAEARGSGLYTALGKYHHTRARDAGVQALFAFASRNSSPGSYPLEVRRLDYRRLLNFHHYARRIGVRSLTGKHLDRMQQRVAGAGAAVSNRVRWGGQVRGLSVTTSQRIPDDCEPALKQIRDYEVLAIWKTLDHLRWRYEQTPDRSYTVHALRRDGETIAFAVSRLHQDSLAICDLLHRRKSVVETAFLLEAVVTHARQAGVQTVEFYGYDNGFFDAAFGSAGFTVLPFSRYIAIGQVLSDSGLAALYYNEPNWSISWGDTDEL